MNAATPATTDRRHRGSPFIAFAPRFQVSRGQTGRETRWHRTSAQHGDRVRAGKILWRFAMPGSRPPDVIVKTRSGRKNHHLHPTVDSIVKTPHFAHRPPPIPSRGGSRSRLGLAEALAAAGLLSQDRASSAPTREAREIRHPPDSPAGDGTWGRHPALS